MQSNEMKDVNLIRFDFQLRLDGFDSAPDNPPTLSPEVADEIYRNMERMPDRQVVDFLVQYFIAEVNWFVALVLLTTTPIRSGMASPSTV